MRCQICNKPLQATESINRGVGEKCADRYSRGLAAAGVSFAEIGQLEDLNDATVNEKLRNAKLAIGGGRIAEAKFWIERAHEMAPKPAPVVETKPEILIQRGGRGTYDFTPPFSNDAFLREFETEIGKPFRFWNTFKTCWQIKPVDQGMLDLIAALLVKHFPGYTARIEHEAARIAA
jgi:hypothetical protein